MIRLLAVGIHSAPISTTALNAFNKLKYFFRLTDMELMLRHCLGEEESFCLQSEFQPFSRRSFGRFIYVDVGISFKAIDIDIGNV